MRIFIDESGTFRGSGVRASPSVVGGLLIPVGISAELFSAYASLRRDLPKDKGEVKGRQLGEADVSRVLQILEPWPVLFEATVLDGGIHRPETIRAHQLAQADLLTRDLERYVHAAMRAELRELADRLRAFPIQLYA